MSEQTFPDVKSILLDDPKVANLLKAGKEFVEGFLPKPSLPPQILVATLADNACGYEIILCHVLGSFDGEEKRQILQRLGYDLYDQQQIPLAIMLATEAWASSDMWRADGSRKYLLCEDDPDRREIVVVQLLTLDRKVAVTSRDTERRDGKLHLAGEWDSPTGCETVLLNSFYRGFFARCTGGVA